MALKKGFKAMMQEASERIHGLAPSKANEAVYQKDVVLVDIRDVRELEKEGHIPGAIHAPRGMLEFWVDPDSPYYKPVFKAEKQFILYCQSGWRSTLATATLLDMGFEEVMHIEGGFNAWKAQGLPVEPYARGN
ncbi:rhodanese-like domain-containing protein [Aestuariibacter sp. A3R04]|uniref:rhodanese-like domain-containing protein n=1 Tax=Aestuariibacter sp. A3R04 TaxID=2841571 RepID=UPI001C08FB04|nr:rhodanese-like domain-containing protein [Aestuariibacter sp. A3R04]MBU3022642.1 rhodanese-like domain-containing protein [Aestuariibacter sp. A3R04]